tara:strand:+ start:456 stop:614 length:159 start_codon:yes stop_codon:yes gene_type:complete
VGIESSPTTIAELRKENMSIKKDIWQKIGTKRILCKKHHNTLHVVAVKKKLK